ncbi:MAG: GTP-binding protein [Candidatus Lokiarchaeota archaeon]|nr:GTP-binding protein [Candidatus Lokiarchaeota archaeon]
MLKHIFLFKGKDLQELTQLNIFCYPSDIIEAENTNLINKIIYGHDNAELVSNYKNWNGKKENHLLQSDSPVAQIIDGMNIYTISIGKNMISGLIFEKEDNPYDYKDCFLETIHELLTQENGFDFENENDVENFLITAFIDIRRYGDEHVEKYPETEFFYDESFVKIFLFGIDDVGKTSLVRRFKTGKYNDNYFIPTKQFNIEYLQITTESPEIQPESNAESTLLNCAFWDMPGQRSFRKKWLVGLQESNVLVFMIDVANQRRFKESKQEFWRIINRYELVNVPVLILANKIDLVNDSKTKKNNEHIKRLRAEIMDYFEFDKLENRKWILLFTSIKTKYNLKKVLRNIIKLA